MTLIEVMVAMSIFAMVIAGGITGVRKGFELVDNSRHYTRISQILQSEMEAMRTLSWKEISQLPTDSIIEVDTQFKTNVYDAYTVSRRVVGETSGRKRVEVTVSFKNRGGRDVSLKYLTFFSHGGVNDYYYRTI